MPIGPLADRINLPVVAWMTGALFSFVGAAIAIRVLSFQLNVFEIGSVRLGGGLIILLGVLLANPSLRVHLRTDEIIHHIPRNLAHALGGILWTIAIVTLPLATVFSLEFTAPAWAAILAYFLLGERLTVRKAIGIVASMIGVLIIYRPASSTFDAMAILPLGAALCFALSALLTRKLVLTRSVFAVLFWMMVLQLPINLAGVLFYPAEPGLVSTPSGLTFASMGLLALSGVLSQFCLSKALSHGEAITVVPLDFLRVPLIAVVGWALFGEVIDLAVFVGMGFIVLGVTYGLIEPKIADPRPPARDRQPERPKETDDIASE